MLRVPVRNDARQDDRGDRLQSPESLSRVIEPAHMHVAGGEMAIWERHARILLDREEQFRDCLFEAPAEEMRGAHCNERRADARVRAEAQRSFGMLYRDVRLARIQP